MKRVILSLTAAAPLFLQGPGINARRASLCSNFIRFLAVVCLVCVAIVIANVRSLSLSFPSHTQILFDVILPRLRSRRNVIIAICSM